MNLTLIGSTNRLNAVELMKEFSYHCGRQCYTEKDFEDVQKEVPSKRLMNKMINAGHHSIFEHIWLNFNMKGLPKMLAMILNNEKQYATSEKSARYTKMQDMVSVQERKYDKWMRKLIPLINKIYPGRENDKVRAHTINNLAKENARYMTSVFTPTKMIHTINFRQLNFLIEEFSRFTQGYNEGGKSLKERLVKPMREFIEETKRFKVEGLENKTERNLSLFNNREVKTNFGDVYSTSYLISFAAFADLERHRTINYHISHGIENGAPKGLFIPSIVSENNLSNEWHLDLEEVAEDDFPQGQLIQGNERGIIEDFRSKAMLRLCGRVQNEVMKNVLKIAREYSQFQYEYGGEKALTPKCMQGFRCAEPCAWTGKNALERII